MSKKAIFLVGFSNWGKSTIIWNLFRKKNIKKYKLHKLSNLEFVVQQSSNDDLKKHDYIKLTSNILGFFPNNDLFTTLCPSMEKDNNFLEILDNKVFNSFDSLNLILLEYKWEGNARLIIDKIKEDVLKYNFNNIDSSKIKIDVLSSKNINIQDKIDEINKLLKIYYNNYT